MRAHIGMSMMFAYGCGSDAPPMMTFGIRATFSSDITEVRLDGETAPLEVAGTSHRLVFDRQYESYAAAMEQGALALEFLRGEEIAYRGSSLPGWCQKLCVYSFCPTPSELESEVYYLAPVTSDFDTFDFDCMDCAGGEKFSKSCN